MHNWTDLPDNLLLWRSSFYQQTASPAFEIRLRSCCAALICQEKAKGHPAGKDSVVALASDLSFTPRLERFGAVRKIKVNFFAGYC